METFLTKLAVAVIPLISIVAIVILCDAHSRKRMIVACKGRKARKGVMQAFAAGIMFR